MKTGRDVVVAALLGAEEFGFATAPLVVSGCVMMRVCHLDTCPVGIATQNPELRKRFSGKPEFVETFFDVHRRGGPRAARRTRVPDDRGGRRPRRGPRRGTRHRALRKAAGLDLGPILEPVAPPEGTALHQVRHQDHGLDQALDQELIARSAPALERGEPVSFAMPIRNVHRTVGTMLGSEVTRRYGGEGLADGTISITFTGSAGQTFGAFLPRGIDLTLLGDTNDYLAKGLSGGRVIVRPPDASKFAAEEQIVAGNVVRTARPGARCSSAAGSASAFACATPAPSPSSRGSGTTRAST